MRACDFPLPGQEHQHVAGMRGERVQHRAPCLLLDRLVARCGKMGCRHRKAPAFARHPRRIEERRQARAVEGGRHHHDAQVAAQRRLHIERERKAEIGGEVAFVELVEQQGADAVERGVLLQHPGQDAFGHDLDARARRDHRFESDAVTDDAADLVAQLP